MSSEPGTPDLSRADAAAEVLLCPGPRFGGAVAARFAADVARRYRNRPHVVLDMTGVTALDAAGLLAISSLGRACRAAGGTLRLCGAGPAVRGLLAAAGVHKFADAHPTCRHAGLD